MPFSNGDFLEIEYSAWDAASNSMISTTEEKKAKEANIYTDKAKYGKVLVVLGSPGIIKGLDRELRKMAIGEQKKFTFKPEDAFGERSEDLVRMMHMSDFRAKDINPYPGMEIQLDSVTAIVKSVSSGRVMVDANNPHAGRDIIYEVKVVSQLSKDADKVTALGYTYGAEPSSIKADEKSLTLVYGSKVNKNADYFVGKANVVASAFTYLKGIESIKVEEEYRRGDIEKQKPEEIA